MALPATHIRFALDLAPIYPVKHLNRYIAGSLYPDSRWLTGVERLKSHGRRYFEPDFPNSDYTYGIHVHCVCDAIQSQLFEAHLPGLRDLEGQDRWVYLSAAKMLQDRFDTQAFDCQDCLRFLNYAENPNQEDPARVLAFNRIVQGVYGQKAILEADDYYRLWVQVGLLPKTAAATTREMERLAGEESTVQFIRGAYERMRQAQRPPPGHEY